MQQLQAINNIYKKIQIFQSFVPSSQPAYVQFN